MKYKNSAYYKGAELWKLLPLVIATSDSTFQFKKNLKTNYNTFVDVLYYFCLVRMLLFTN